MSQLQGVGLPGAYREAFQALASADQAVVEQVVARLGQQPLPVDRSDLLALLALLVGDQAGGLLDALLTLLALQRYLPHLPLADPVPLAERASHMPGLDLADNIRAQLEQRVDALLRARTLLVVDRAQDLLREVPYSFVDARIITDVRPLFIDPPSEPPAGAIITQTLRLEYRSEHTSQDVSTLFIALDDKNLLTIREALDRAADKMTSLRTFLGTSALPHVELFPEETE